MEIRKPRPSISMFVFIALWYLANWVRSLFYVAAPPAAP
jgi:hypothetical protein